MHAGIRSAAIVPPRKTNRQRIGRFSRFALLVTVFTMPSAAFGQAPGETEASETQLNDIIVTAQRRSESVQDVPLSVTVLGAEQLEQLQVQRFEDYLRFLPSVASNGANAGFNATVVVRGIVADQGNVASGSLPTVGQYLDEQPITTIDGAPDLHMYDIARVEQLSGPQGTLFGASSMGGVLRVITNKPDPDKFAAGMDFEINKYTIGSFGGSVEGFVNVPVGNGAALRVVGWYVKEGGYVDNRPGSRTYSTGITVNNSPYARKDYNYAETYGARAALAVPLGENWTVTPSIIAQQRTRNGTSAYVPDYGDLVTETYTREDGEDRWYQAALTVQGQVGDFDILYAGSYLDRSTKQHINYADYDYYYDQQYAIFPSGAQRVDNAGRPIDPRDTLINNERFTKQSHEVRITSPSDKSLRFLAGAFFQRQFQDIDLDYNVPGLADRLAVTGRPGATWVTRQERIDRDYALFGQADFDIADRLTLTAGIRGYRYNNSLFGWFGGKSNEPFCFAPAILNGSPCTNLGTPTGSNSASPRSVKGDGVTYRLGATFKITPNNMIYFTVADGFRPGGTNRLGERGQQNFGSASVPYGPDKLTNYELGTKNTFWNGRARLNVILFNQEWRDIQLGTAINGVNLIQNVAKARSRGVEVSAGIQPTSGLNLSINGAYVDAKLLSDYIVNGTTIVPANSRLAYSPKFKANAILRYDWTMGEFEPFMQVAQSYQSDTIASFNFRDRNFYDNFPSYGVTDISLGFKKGPLQIEGYATNLFDKRAATYRSYLFYLENIDYYQYVARPRQVGFRTSFRF